MTPIILQDALLEEMEELFKDYVYKTPSGGRIPLNVFPQNLPVNETDDEEDPIPYLIIRLMDGEDEGSRESFHAVNLMVSIGIWDDELNAQGHKDVMNIIQKIYQRFHENPDLNHIASFQGGFHWALDNENCYPYYFGGCSMSFGIAAVRREDEFA